MRRTVGKGQVLYIGSGLDAVYAETRMKRLRTYLGSLIEPLMKDHRTYEIEWQSGVLPHLTFSRDTLLLHLLADTGNKFKKLRAREEFLPVENVKVKIRIPQGRTVKAVTLLRDGGPLRGVPAGGWLGATVPRVFIHEAVRVDLA